MTSFKMTSHEARVMKEHISIILQICEKFGENTYITNYNKRNFAAMENTKVVHE